MRYILEIKGNDDSETERIVSYEDSSTEFHKAQSGVWGGTTAKVTLWREFDSMEDAPADDGCCYRLVDRDGKRSLRRCSAATGS